MIKFGRLQRILSIAAVLTVATMALPQVVSGATPKPVISMLTVVPTSLPPEGGTAQVTATVSNAGKCFVQVNSYAGNFSKSATVSAGTCNQTINVPANDSSTTMFVSITLLTPALIGHTIWTEQNVTISVAPNTLSTPAPSTTTTTILKNSGTKIMVPADPNELLISGPNVWVTSCNANTITEIEVDTHQIVQEITDPLYGLVCPTSLALVGGDIWVTDRGNNSITVMSASNGALVEKLAGPGIVSPFEVASTGSEVWVNGSNGLSEFDTSGNYLGGTRGGPTINDGTFISVGVHIWAMDLAGGPMVEYDARTGIYLRSRPDTTGIFGSFSYHGGVFWGSSESGNNPLYEYSALTGTPLRIVKNAFCGGIPFYDGSALFADCQSPHGVESLREYTSTGKLVRTLFNLEDHRYGEFQSMVVVGKELWVANSYSDSVDVISLD